MQRDEPLEQSRDDCYAVAEEDSPEIVANWLELLKMELGCRRSLGMMPAFDVVQS